MHSDLDESCVQVASAEQVNDLYEEVVTCWVSPGPDHPRESNVWLQIQGCTLAGRRTLTFGECFGHALLVAQEQVGHPAFQKAIESLIRRRRLTRDVVDVAHIAVLSKNDREGKLQLKSASRFGTACHVFLSSATAQTRVAEACGSSLQSLEINIGDSC